LSVELPGVIGVLRDGEPDFLARFEVDGHGHRPILDAQPRSRTRVRRIDKERLLAMNPATDLDHAPRRAKEASPAADEAGAGADLRPPEERVLEGRAAIG
jgi:hypothetical protein